MLKFPVEEALERTLKQVGYELGNRFYSEAIVERAKADQLNLISKGTSTSRDYNSFVDRQGRSLYLFLRLSDNPHEEDPEISLSYGVGYGAPRIKGGQEVAQIIDRNRYRERITFRRKLLRGEWVDVGRLDVRRTANKEYMSNEETRTIIEKGSCIFAPRNDALDDQNKAIIQLMLGPRIIQERTIMRKLGMPNIMNAFLSQFHGMPVDELGLQKLMSGITYLFRSASRNYKEEDQDFGDDGNQEARIKID